MIYLLKLTSRSCALLSWHIIDPLLTLKHFLSASIFTLNMVLNVNDAHKKYFTSRDYLH